MFSQSDMMELARFSSSLKAIRMHPHAGRPGHVGGSAPSKSPNPAGQYEIRAGLNQHLTGMKAEAEHLGITPTQTFGLTASPRDINTGAESYSIGLFNGDPTVVSRHGRRVEVYFKTQGEKIKRAFPGAKVVVLNATKGMNSHIKMEVTLPGYERPVERTTRFQHALPRGMRASKGSGRR